MMPRKYCIVLVITLLIVAASAALGAKADRAARVDRQNLQPIENLPLAGTAEHDAWLAKNSSPGTAMGFRGPEDRFVGQKIGSTWYDYQHNGSMGRNIAQGSDARIHFAWMQKWNSGGIRSIYYNSAVFSGGQWVLSEDTSGTSISGTNGGYCNIDVWGVKAVPAWHEGPTENSYSIYSGIDFGSGSGSFQTSAAPVGPTCTGHTTDGDDGPGNYIWPIGAIDVGFASDPRFHAVGHESTTNTFQSFVYFQGNGNPTVWGTCGTFVDSVSDIAGIVRQDPNSDDVCVAWIKPRQYGADGNQYNNDVVYVESNDGGVNWPTPGTYTNLTNHVDTDLERPYCNLTGIYTDDGCLHIGWDSPGYYDADGTISIAPCKLYHWDDCNDCISLIIDADNVQTCAPGAWNRNVTKQNFTECDGKLYCIYTYFNGDTEDYTEDCSAGGWANGEIYAQVSSTGGETWGPPVNLTNTPDNGCAASDCESEHWSSTVMYADSLYIFYVGDTDAGGIVQTEGTWTESPMMFMVNPCFDMETYVDLSATPDRFWYPMNTPPNTPLDTSFVLTNTGNTTANWSHSVDYTSGSGWINIYPGSGTVGAGCNNSETINATFTGPWTEGLYEATININFSKAVQDVDVELYVFDEFCLPEHVRLRTSANLLSVAQEGRAANQDKTAGFVWFADTANYLFDGGLIIGNSGTGEWDFNIHHRLGDEPTFTNPWGRLYTNDCAPEIDTSGTAIRFMKGTGLNHDSTIAFDCDWYCDGYPDSNDFYVMHVDMYAGPNFYSTINNLVIAYACDWDIPSDTGQDNCGFVDAALQTVYQQGLYGGSPSGHDQRWGGIAYRGHNASTEFASGGVVWDNPRYVYPVDGYHVDSLQNRLPDISNWYTDIPDSSTAGDDLNSIIVVDNNATLGYGDNIEFNIVFWAINPHEIGSGTIEQILAKAETFICGNGISPDAPFCAPEDTCLCGDANNDGSFDISDAVWIVQYLFGGPPPDPYCLGEADGCGIIDLADVVYYIQYIFAGGPAPMCSDGQNCPTWYGDNTIELGCPVVAESSTGDSVGIPVYITNDIGILGLSVGFRHNSNHIEMTSFSMLGSILETGTIIVDQMVYPETNGLMVMWSSATELVPQTDGFIGTIWFEVPIGTPPHTVNVDSSIATPQGNFMFVAPGSVRIFPEYLDCGSADLIISYDADSCALQYPGDTDSDGDIDPLDLAYLVSFLYGTGPAPDPLSNGDPTGDCCIDSADIVFIEDYLYSGGSDPVDCTCINPGILCHDVCSNSFTDPVFLICPGGDAEFEVHLRDECNDPVPWVNSVWIELYACEGLNSCPDGPPLDNILPLGPSDANGVLRFVYAGGGYDGNCVAVVKIPDGRCDIATVPVLSFDVNGDLGVSLDEYDDGSLCCDFNGSGSNDQGDFNLFFPHLGHYCGLTPCERFSSDFQLTPATDHVPGINVTLDLILTNNNFDSCYIGLVEFYYSPIGSGQNEQIFDTEYFNRKLGPGEEDTITTQYTVPASGSGCLIVRFDNPDCCGGWVEESACFEYNWHCTADSTLLYEFYIQISGTPPVDSILRLEYIEPGWPFTVVHWPTPPYSNDFIHYQVGTVADADLGTSSTIYTLIFEDGNTQPRTIRNRVIITPQTGDCNGDCVINISDAVYLIQYIFAGGDPPLPYQSGDVNCDGVVNITDAVYIISYIFGGGPEPCLVNPFFKK